MTLLRATVNKNSKIFASDDVPADRARPSLTRTRTHQEHGVIRRFEPTVACVERLHMELNTHKNAVQSSPLATRQPEADT